MSEAVTLAAIAKELYTAVFSDVLDELGHRDQALAPSIRPLDDELVMELSGHDFIAGLDDGAGVRAADSAQFAVHACSGLLDMRQSPDQIGHVRDLLARNGEILDGTGRLHAPVRIGRNFHGSQKIDFCPGHGCHKACSHLSWKKWPGGGCGVSPGKAMHRR